MDTSYEAIKSLIDLLVKKSGFDITKNYSENELKKTKDAITKLETDKDSLLTEENRKELISNLKLRQANWENNAEVIGKALLSCFNENKTFNEVRAKIEYLSTLAKKDESKRNGNSLMGYIYSRIKELESRYQDINIKLENNDYVDIEEKEVDLKLKEYLNNKLDSYNDEVKNLETELDRLKDVEEKEKIIADKLKGYIACVRKDVEALDKLKKSSLDKGITIEVWEKIETIELNIREKLEKASNIMKKTNKMVEDVKINREEINSKKENTQKEINKLVDKLEDVTERLNNDDYIDYARKIEDINEKELVRLELEELRNKKEVIYVDVDKVKEELIKEWSKGSNNDIKEETSIEIVEPEESSIKDEEIVDVVKTEELEKKEEIVPKEINKIELDW